MKLGLIGEKLGHSLSPEIHQKIFEKLGIDEEVAVFLVEDAVVDDEAVSLFRKFLEGFINGFRAAADDENSACASVVEALDDGAGGSAMAHDEDFLAFDIGRDLVERPRKSIIVSVVAVPFAVTDSNGIDGADGPGFGGYFIQEGHDVCLVRDGDIEAVHAFKEGFDGILQIHPGDRKQVVGAANAQFFKILGNYPSCISEEERKEQR